MSVNISQRDLHEYYLRPYQSCVERANVSGLMCRLVGLMLATQACCTANLSAHRM